MYAWRAFYAQVIRSRWKNFLNTSVLGEIKSYHDEKDNHCIGSGNCVCRLSETGIR